MTLRVHPDPQEPAGGFAFLELETGSLPDGPQHVAVFDAFGERWLARAKDTDASGGIGKALWQTERYEFGPYEVYRHDGADWVRIGPEIVNQLDEYAPLRFTLAGRTHEVSWPDNVPQRAGAAVLGGLQPVGRKQAEIIDRRVGTVELDSPEDDGIVVPERPVATENAPEELGVEPEPGRSWLLPLLLAVVLVGAFLAWYFWPDPEPAPAPAPLATGQAEPCSRATLAATRGGFVAIADAIRACGSDVQPDTALSLVEEAAAVDDPDALLLFGTLYDGESLDPRIENLTGLTFVDDPAQAAEYYARAVNAGSDAAAENLSKTCERLADDDATLARGAYDDFCS
ncbi:SEL1-like repeat protein [Sedimentitalea todarodis]|uniref:DUF4178 domain-containing protein n=1 Tax=Sedimentitalea todarodis TaxID=1631240 RepID=A0ABU3VB30_9RHOB|nr:hypothetical protein [Sedimentitalea todarodis]MDU9003380.1 hypothetical protein [Sedimentitalea todarodis]